MTDRHARPPISFRPRKEIEPWLDAYVDETGKSLGAVLNEAIELLRQQVEHGTATGTAVLPWSGFEDVAAVAQIELQKAARADFLAKALPPRRAAHAVTCKCGICRSSR